MALSEQLLAEYRALTAGAGYVDLSDRTKIELTGDDRAAFLHNFCTNDVKRLKPGELCEAFVCNVKGHTLGHAFVVCEEAPLWIDTVAGQAEKLVAHLDRYLIREKVTIADRTEAFAELLLAGDKASTIVEALAAVQNLRTCRADIAANGSWLVSMPRESLGDVVDALERAGAARCSREALEIVRIESGFPWYGVDITDENLPQEVGRDAQAISFTKGCYLGQETVARIDALGHVNKLLCRVAFEGDSVPARDTELGAGDQGPGTGDREGRRVGQVTSACWLPQHSRPLALAYVRRSHAKPGSELASAVGRATVL